MLTKMFNSTIQQITWIKIATIRRISSVLLLSKFEFVFGKNRYAKTAKTINNINLGMILEINSLIENYLCAEKFKCCFDAIFSVNGT